MYLLNRPSADPENYEYDYDEVEEYFEFVQVDEQYDGGFAEPDHDYNNNYYY